MLCGVDPKAFPLFSIEPQNSGVRSFSTRVCARWLLFLFYLDLISRYYEERNWSKTHFGRVYENTEFQNLIRISLTSWIIFWNHQLLLQLNEEVNGKIRRIFKSICLCYLGLVKEFLLVAVLLGKVVREAVCNQWGTAAWSWVSDSLPIIPLPVACDGIGVYR